MEDSSSVNSYRIPGVGHTSASASGSVKSGYAPIEIHQVDGDDVNGAMGYVRSSSPVSNVSLSGDEVTPATVALRRSARRTRFTVDRNISDANDGSLEASDDHTQSTTIMEHVRFDDHVSYIDRIAPTDDIHTRPPHDVATADCLHQQTETFTS